MDLKSLKEFSILKINPWSSARSIAAIALLAVVISLIVSPVRSGVQAGDAAAAQRPNQTVIFAIGGESGFYHMDAVALVNGKQFVSPFSDEQKDKQKTFAEKYFAAGRQYRLIFGGSGAGPAIVNKWTEGCNSEHADVNVTT